MSFYLTSGLEDFDWFEKAADVGVGISGEEGLQAVNSSDYAISQVKLTLLFILHLIKVGS